MRYCTDSGRPPREMSRPRDTRPYHGWLFMLSVISLLCCCRVALCGTTDVHRLPGDTRPLSYELAVKTNYDRVAETVEFEGYVKIAISVSFPTSVVTLNCRDLVVHVVYAYENRTQESLDAEEYYDSANERLMIYLDSQLDVDVEYVLEIYYYGKTDNGSDGFYSSFYGHDEWLLPTYIGPTGARRIFPCYDEPAYKTSFKISLSKQPDKFVRSNMPPIVNSNVFSNEVESSNEIWTTFFETPPMSTHQVAFVISAFDRMSATGDRAINVFVRPGCLNQIQNVISEAPLLLKAMEDFTEMQYELPALDLLAVPDLKSDAMGNWGLNTYREKFLLLDDTSSAKDKESGLSMVQRQMAHQWFGNLVTCAWWDYLWLHDAFATYFQYFATHSVHPDWKMDQLFVAEQHQPALAHDQTVDRSPITVAVQSATEIERAFYDNQTGRKAAAFLRMLKHATNDTVFQQSLVRYLQQNKYGAAEPGQLFDAFEQTLAEHQFDFGHGDVTVSDFMRQWTEQAGYPVIKVIKTNGSFIMTQERFLIDTGDNTTDLTKWPIGITYTTESRKNFDNVTVTAWFKPSESTYVLPALEDPGWFIFNVQSTGLYRVNYEEDNWSSLISHLKTSSSDIHVLNRAQLVDDSFNLARADMLHYSVPLELSSYLMTEDDVLPWYSVINGYSYLLERMRRNDIEYLELKICVNNLADVIYKKVEDLIVIQGNTDHTVLASWNAFSVWACGLDNDMCTQSAYEYYQKWQKGEKIPTDIRDAAFCVGIRITNDTLTWEQMLDIYKTTKSPSEKKSAQTALACTENDELLWRYLNYMFVHKDGPIRAQDYKDVIIAVSSTPKGLDVLIDFLVKNVNDFRQQITDGDDIAIFMYSVCASKSALDNEIIRIRNLKNGQNIPKNLREAFNESYLQVENNLYWYNKYHEIVRENSGCFSHYTTTVEPQSSTTDIYTQSTTEYSTAVETSTYEIPSTTEFSTTTETSSSEIPSTTEFNTTTETSSSEIPSTTEFSTTTETSSSEIPSTTEFSTTTETSSSEIPSTTEYSTTTEISSSEIPSTTEFSTTTETSSSEIPSTTEFSTTIETSSSEIPSTTEYSTTTETSSSEIPSTTEFSTTTEISSSEIPSTTEFSTTTETSSSEIPSTTEYSTTTETSSSEIPSTTEFSTTTEISSSEIPSTTEFSTTTETSSSEIPSTDTSSQPPPTYYTTISTEYYTHRPFYMSSHVLYSSIVFLIISAIFVTVVSVLLCYGPRTKYSYRNVKSMSSP